MHKRLFKGYIGGIALIFCLSGLPAQEGDEATTPPPQFVTLITVKPQLKKDVWKLRIVAKAPQLPEKSRIDFLNTFGKVGELLYQVQMRGAQGTGADAGKIVATPALDDVTLTVYLPSAEFLLTESLN